MSQAVPPSPPEADPGASKADPAALRRFGLVAGGGGILAAVAIALVTGQEPAPAPVDPAPPPVAGAPTAPIAAPELPEATTAPASPQTGSAASRPKAEPQSASPQPENGARPAARPAAFCPQGEDRPTILVAFERSHPMHEAQRLFAEGRRDEARALAARLLAERRDLRGLCLDRFSIGGAEIHVGAPSAASVTEWVERLSGMDGVERAEAELIAAPF